MTKKLLIINDIPGAGKVAGNINFPILSAACFEVSILPTLILSKNTDYDRGEVVRYSMDEGFNGLMDHWAQAQVPFDLFTTGYFERKEQISDFYKYYHQEKSKRPGIRLYVDPIMGDHGRLYPGFNEEVPEAIGQLCSDAYLVVPNLTEACLMTGIPYKEEMSEDQLAELAQALVDMGAQHVALSGIEDKDDQGRDLIGFYLYRPGEPGEFILHQKYPSPFFGTGDLAMSLIIAFHENGLSLKDSLVKTGQLIEKALELTLALDRSYQEGIFFEPILLDVAQFASKGLKEGLQKE